VGLDHGRFPAFPGTGDQYVSRGTGGLAPRSLSSVPILSPLRGHRLLWASHDSCKLEISPKLTIQGSSPVLTLYCYHRCELAPFAIPDDPGNAAYSPLQRRRH